MGGVAILIYHRISFEVPDPQLLCVTPANFQQHAEHLKRHYDVISLQELKPLLEKKRRPKKTVVVTFDDGYADNYWNAYPVLKRYGLPATLFVVSRYIDQDCELVHDEVERLILGAPRLPSHIAVEVGGTRHDWQLDTEGPQSIPWDVTRAEYPTSRHRCYHDLHRLLRGADYESRSTVVAALRVAIQDPPPPRQARRPLSSREILELAASGFVNIGAHTHSHLFLAKQSTETQLREIRMSKERLEELLGGPVSAFAYPYGGSEAVSDTTRDCVKRVGFELACDNWPRLAGRLTDPLMLPRFLVRNWSGDEFARRLKHLVD